MQQVDINDAGHEVMQKGVIDNAGQNDNEVKQQDDIDDAGQSDHEVIQQNDTDDADQNEGDDKLYRKMSPIMMQAKQKLSYIMVT